MIFESPQNIPIMVISGTLLEGDERKFTKIALEHDRAVVAFDSPEGDLLAEIGLGKAIRLKELVTPVGEVDECASACGLAWLGKSSGYLIRTRELAGSRNKLTLTSGSRHPTCYGHV